MITLLGLLVKYLIGLIGITLVVIIHEIGHLIAAKVNGIDVEVFSFGLGPKLVGWKIKGTEYRLSLFPLGGYCRLKGSDDLSQALLEDKKSFIHTEAGSLFSAHPLKRAITYGAGPLANICLAVLLYALLASLPVRIASHQPIVATVDEYPLLFNNQDSPAARQGLETGDYILRLSGREIIDWEDLSQRLALSSGMEVFTIKRGEQIKEFEVVAEENGDGTYRFGLTLLEKPQVGSVRTFSAEAKAGLKQGDLVIAVDGRRITDHLQLLQTLPTHPRSVKLTVQRDGDTRTISFTPKSNEVGKSVYEFSLAAAIRSEEGMRFNLLDGWQQAKEVIYGTLGTLRTIFRGTEQEVRSSVTGMARSALIIGDYTTLGFEQDTRSGLQALLYLMGVVSISLAIANLLPLPAFDGGQILIAILEWIRGKQIRPKTYYVLQLVGVFCVVLIFVLLTLVDVRYWLSLKR